MQHLEPEPLSVAWQQRLVQSALASRDRAYAPYSNFRVGAAILTAGQYVFEGANIENASYGLTVCAERVAMSAAMMQGQRDWIAAVVAAPGGCTPCGACRQFLFEFGPRAWVYVADSDSAQILARYRLSDLLPFGFSGNALSPSPPSP